MHPQRGDGAEWAHSGPGGRGLTERGDPPGYFLKLSVAAEIVYQAFHAGEGLVAGHGVQEGEMDQSEVHPEAHSAPHVQQGEAGFPGMDQSIVSQIRVVTPSENVTFVGEDDRRQIGHPGLHRQRPPVLPPSQRASRFAVRAFQPPYRGVMIPR